LLLRKELFLTKLRKSEEVHKCSKVEGAVEEEEAKGNEDPRI